MQEKKLALIYGADYDLINGKTYSTLPDWIRRSVPKLGLKNGLARLALCMLSFRYGMERKVPPAKRLAEELQLSYRHVLGMLKVLQEAGLVLIDKAHRPFTISIVPLIARLRTLDKAKDAAPPALHLVSRPAPKPKPAPAPRPDDPLPPAAEIDEDEITAKLVEKTEMSAIMNRSAVGSGPWRLAHRRWKYLDDWLRKYAPVLVAAAMGGA